MLCLPSRHDIPIYTIAMPCVLPIVYLLVTDIRKEVRSQVLLYRFYLSELCIKRSSTLTVWVSCRHDTLLRMPIIT